MAPSGCGFETAGAATSSSISRSSEHQLDLPLRRLINAGSVGVTTATAAKTKPRNITVDEDQ